MPGEAKTIFAQACGGICLAHIMPQCCEGQHIDTRRGAAHWLSQIFLKIGRQVRGYIELLEQSGEFCQRLQRMVIGREMMIPVLLQSLQRLYLGQYLCEQAQVVHQLYGFPGLPRSKCPKQFFAQSFARDEGDLFGVFANITGGLPFDHKVVVRRKAHCAHIPGRVHRQILQRHGA